MNTVQQAIAWARQKLASVPGAEPLDASILLGYVLDVPRTELIAYPERVLTGPQADRFRELIEQRAQGMPVAYLIGTHPFYDLPHDLIVTPDVLIPRPETEHLIEAALKWAAAHPVQDVADVGTGSGAIAVTLAYKLPVPRVWALDVSEEALGIALRNAKQLELVPRVRFSVGDLLAPLVEFGITCDMIAANLPYIASAEVDVLPVVQHEPRLALDGGADGLDLIRRLLADVPAVLAQPGLLLLEIGTGQGAQVAELAAEALPGAQVEVLHDLAGHDRIVQVQRGSA